MPPAVTVLLPVHNASAFVRQAVESILSQTFADFELLAIDDASEDDSLPILQSFTDPRLRIIASSERKKLAGVLNRGIAESRAPLIARMDADDVCHPERLARQIDFLHRHPEIDIVGTSIRTFGGHKAESQCYPLSPESVRAFSLFHCPFAHPTVVIRRDALALQDPFYDVSFNPSEDYELWSRLLSSHQGANLHQALLSYRIHASSMTQSDWTRMDEQAARIQQPMLAALGADSSESSSRRHRAWAMGRIDPSLPALREAEQWFLRLLDLNHSSSLYDARAFSAVVSDIWFTLAMRCNTLGWPAWRMFTGSRLARSPNRLRHSFILGLSIMRQSIRSRSHARPSSQHL